MEEAAGKANGNLPQPNRKSRERKGQKARYQERKSPVPVIDQNESITPHKIPENPPRRYSRGSGTLYTRPFRIFRSNCKETDRQTTALAPSSGKANRLRWGLVGASVSPHYVIAAPLGPGKGSSKLPTTSEKVVHRRPPVCLRRESVPLSRCHEGLVNGSLPVLSAKRGYLLLF
ncbi:hypothetical protein VTI74DRAFT_4437 [Chaetomium olivicolor]